MAKKLARRIKKLEEQIEELQRFEGLPGDKVEAWARFFARLDDRDITEEDLDDARGFVAYCVRRGKEPTWVEFMQLANSDE